MSAERDQAGGESLSAKAEQAERELQKASEAAEAARERTTADIRSLEADLEGQRLRAQEELEKARADHAEEMERLRASNQEEIQRERAAKESAIAAAESRLAEIESQAEAAEKRVLEAQREAGASSGSPRSRAHAGSGGRPRCRRACPRRRGRLAAGPDRGDPRGGEAEITSGREFDVAVVGGGAAGLWSAISAAEAGAEVCLLSRTPLSLSASYWAQGGLAAALEPGDSPARHAADTIAAGRGCCRPAAVEALVEEAPGIVRELRERGVEFDLDPDGELALGLEGGHTRRRIVHAGGSQTGHEITSKLAADGLGRAADRGPGDDLGAGPLERRIALPRGGHGGRADRGRARRCSRPAAPRRSGGGRRTRVGRSAPAR